MLQSLNIAEVAGTVAAIFGVLINIPQLILVIRTRQTRDISALSIVFILIGNAAWTLNGYLSDSPSRMYSGIAIFILASFIFYFKIGETRLKGRSKI